jgi:DNA-binding NarL/FixJ family response regulator
MPTRHDRTDSAAKSVRTIPIVQTWAKRILVVDDNASVCGALRHFIETHTALQVCEARDGAEAVKQAELQHPDVIVMDLVMPNKNGIEAASVIKSLLPHTLIVVFTLHSDVIGEALAKAIGVDVIVSKSEGAAGLIKALQPIWNENSPS